MRILVIVSHEGSGIVQPMIRQLEESFGTVYTISVRLPFWLRSYYLVKTFNVSKQKWYQQWKIACERRPSAFRALTRECERQLRGYLGNIDAIVQFGAVSGLGKYGKEFRYFIITDSTRKLSSCNSRDHRSQFRTQHEADEWYGLETEVYTGAAGIIARSQRVGNSLVQEYGVQPERVLVRALGVGLDHSDGKFRKKYDGTTILFVGKGDFVAKGGEDMLRAFEIVKREVTGARLIVVGQKGEARDGVEFKGLLSDRAELRQLFEDAHLFVLPSYIDRFGMTILEAMAARTPCIGYDQGAIPELIGDAGFVISKGDYQGLASAIIKLLKSESMSTELGDKARKRFDALFSWESVRSDVRDFVVKAVP